MKKTYFYDDGEQIIKTIFKTDNKMLQIMIIKDNNPNEVNIQLEYLYDICMEAYIELAKNKDTLSIGLKERVRHIELMYEAINKKGE